MPTDVVGCGEVDAFVAATAAEEFIKDDDDDVIVVVVVVCGGGVGVFVFEKVDVS